METSTIGRAIVISNGRCGSTLLSDLIAEDRKTLSVQEFFMPVVPGTKLDETVTGAAYWDLLSSPSPDLVTLFAIGLPPKEVRYPAHGRWAGDLARIPRILPVTLAKLTSDPDALYDAAAARVPGFPAQTFAAHHRMFLDLLTELTGRRRWVERSGGSSFLAPYLLRGFPDAKVVYLTRDRDETARSMSRHSSFQLTQLRVEFLGRYGVDPLLVRPGQEVPAEVAPYTPGRITAELLRARGDDPRRFQGLCAFLTNQAEQALADHPPRRLHTMRYADLVADPAGELARLGRFLEFDDPTGWARRVADRVHAPAHLTASSR